MPDRVGPIIFSAMQPREQLVQSWGGTVYSFRSGERTTGETDARAGRTMKAFADVRISEEAFLADVTTEKLDPYADQSGFGSARRWREAIEQIHDDPENGYIYQVSIIGLRQCGYCPVCTGEEFASLAMPHGAAERCKSCGWQQTL